MVNSVIFSYLVQTLYSAVVMTCMRWQLPRKVRIWQTYEQAVRITCASLHRGATPIMFPGISPFGHRLQFVWR